MIAFAEREVRMTNKHGHLVTVAKYHTSVSNAKRLGWRFGVTHSKKVGSVRYIFHDGVHYGAPCLTSTLIKRTSTLIKR